MPSPLQPKRITYRNVMSWLKTLRDDHGQGSYRFPHKLPTHCVVSIFVRNHYRHLNPNTGKNMVTFENSRVEPVILDKGLVSLVEYTDQNNPTISQIIEHFDNHNYFLD